MKLKNSLLAIALTGALTLTACSHQSSHSPTAETAQSSTPEMDHGMDHGSMNLGPRNETFDLRFIDGMIPHHEGAVLMAQEALQKSNRSEIKQLAQQIIDAQEQEISELKSWRQAWYSDAPAEPIMFHEQMNHDMPMSEEMRSQIMMAGDLGAADDQFDLRFISAMIPHHEGAIEMANQALQNSDRSEIKTLSQSIIDSQQREIDQMNEWKRSWYG